MIVVQLLLLGEWLGHVCMVGSCMKKKKCESSHALLNYHSIDNVSLNYQNIINITIYGHIVECKLLHFGFSEILFVLFC
jgi:hypothetical protein